MKDPRDLNDLTKHDVKPTRKREGERGREGRGGEGGIDRKGAREGVREYTPLKLPVMSSSTQWTSQGIPPGFPLV